MAPTDLVDDDTTDEEPYEPRCRRCWDDGIVDDDDGEYGMAACPCGATGERGATSVETLAGTVVVIVMLLFVLVLVKGWPWAGDDGASPEEQRKTRHAICEVLDTVGADATSRADVEACTFPEEGEN